jgi:phospholipid/cholesterol/gamma-HCH transport system substrate-binding protein
MRHAISKHLGDFIAVLALLVIAGGVSVYILSNQRLRFPIVESKPFQLKGEFITGQAVTPGQGQTVRVSGVRIGDIAKVDLVEGRAIITFDIEREYAGLVRKNWTGLLRPKTGLKDMFVELRPGVDTTGEPAPEGFTIPVSNTLPDVNPDEFLAALDSDTRDYLKLLLNGARGGLENRADDLNAVLKRFEPTYRDISRVSTEVAKRRVELRRLMNSLQRLNTELGRKDEDLAELVSTSAEVFRSFAAEEANVARTVQELPGALEATTDALGKVERFAQVLRPSADRIRPAVRALRRANAETLPFAKEAEPQLREQIRPFVRELRPLVRELRPAAHNLVEAEPDFKRVVVVFNHLFNMLGYNPNGREEPGKEGRDEGYLFSFAWLTHQSVSLFGGQDAHGVFRPLITGGTCNTIRSTADSIPGGAGAAILGLTGVLQDPRVCGSDPPVASSAAAAKKAASAKEVTR